jgi:glycosyltransferase involved in cell wall biosynthesis
LDDVVHFEGDFPHEQIIPYYAGADLFLFPSRYDVSSIVQIEAATYKTPTVFSKGSVTSCTVTDKVNGYILTHNQEAFSQGIIDILESGTMQQVGENALRDLHKNWHQIVADSVVVYNQLMNAKK